MANPTNQVITPVVCKPIVKGQRNLSMLAPLAGVIAQDAHPYVSEWMCLGAGSTLQLKLNITDFVGTMIVLLETASDKEQTPRFLAAFEQMPGVVGSFVLIGPPPVCDEYVRVLATPGKGAGQRCSWTVTGQAIVPYAPIT